MDHLFSPERKGSSFKASIFIPKRWGMLPRFWHLFAISLQIYISHVSSKLTYPCQIITVALSMMVFHDDVSPLNVSGLLLAIVGAVWYRQYKQKPGSSLSIYLSSAGEAGGEGSSSVGGMRTPTTESVIFHLNEFSSDEEEEEEDDDRAVGRVPGDEEAVEVEMYNISRAQLA